MEFKHFFKAWGSIVFLMFFVLPLDAQVKITLKDNVDSTGVGFAELVSTADGVYAMSNVKGVAITSFKRGEKVHVHALGYIDVDFIARVDTTLFLFRNIEVLDDIELTDSINSIITLGNNSKRKKVSVGVRSGSKFSYSVGLLIENVDSILVTSVSFYIGKQTKIGSAYRLRILEVPNSDPNQGKDLLNSSIVRQISSKSSWQKVVLPQPLFTEKNLLVAIEILPEGEACFLLTGNDSLIVKPEKFKLFMSQTNQNCNLFEKTFLKNKTKSWRKQCYEKFFFYDPEKPHNPMIFISAVKL